MLRARQQISLLLLIKAKRISPVTHVRYHRKGSYFCTLWSICLFTSKGKNQQPVSCHEILTKLSGIHTKTRFPESFTHQIKYILLHFFTKLINKINKNEIKEGINAYDKTDTYRRCSQFSIKIHLSKFKLYFYVGMVRKNFFKVTAATNILFPHCNTMKPVEQIHFLLLLYSFYYYINYSLVT